ncbi:hypothetical protein [Sulfurimonas sp.]|uniref:hypothetical protein n=1 Tax=Sulfurimonas sp. TaxID=2022749 RepID=UPI002B48AAF6|nr:hypothetical protein [Sulfurimonas sp.]
MIEYGITALQTKPSLFKEMTISKIVDKRKHQDIGYFISAKYKDMISSVLMEIEKKEKIAKLKQLKKHQDMEFLELGVDDGLA